MDDATLKAFRRYTSNCYTEIIRLQIYLADNNISFSYTDTVSPAELSFLAESVSDYLKEKSQANAI